MKHVPTALRAETGARGPSSWSVKHCETCAEDTHHQGNRCIHCKSGGVPTGPLWEQKHSIRGRRKS